MPDPAAPPGASGVPSGPEHLTPAWLTAALHAAGIQAECTGLAVSQLGAGQGFVGHTLRLCPSYAVPGSGPASLVAKLPSSNPRTRAMLQPLRYYEREVRFYQELAPTSALAVPRCYHAAYDPPTGDAVLLLEDLAGATPGDDLAGCPPGHALPLVERLAAFHAAHWGRRNGRHLPWLPSFNQNQPDEFYERVWRKMAIRHRAVMPPAFTAIGEALRTLLPAYRARMASDPVTVVHGDLRTDNLLFGAGRTWVVDWQLVAWARAGLDLGYLTTQSFTPEARREVEAALVNRYHQTLVACGVTGYSLEDCRQDYRLGCLQNALTFVYAGGSLDFSGPRARQLLTVTLQRITAAVADHQPFALLHA